MCDSEGRKCRAPPWEIVKASCMALFILSVAVALVFHELGHVMAAVLLGVRVKRIGINWKGAYIVRDRGTDGQCFAIALAGPSMNIVLALLWHGTGMAQTEWVFGLVNLLPIAGSDGDRVLRLVTGKVKQRQT